jgi:transitional endoplasmic reticulum ATPase
MNTVSEFTSWTFGIAAVLVARYLFGMSWVTSVFLFLPFFSLINNVMANDGRKMAKALILILLYPVACFFVGDITASVVTFLQNNGMKVSEMGFPILKAIVVSGFFVILSIVASILSSCVGDFSIPDLAHAILIKVLSIASTSLIMLLLVEFLLKINNEFREIPSVLKFLVAIVIGGVFIMVVRRLLSGSRVRADGSPSSGSEKYGDEGDAKAVRLASRPNLTMADVMGMDDAKEQIRLRLIEPVRNPQRAKMYAISVGGGVLLYGPPGTGKTMLARAVAGELNLPFYLITSADVFSRYAGVSERNIKRLFAEIRRNPLSVVFIDELETLFPSRSVGDVHETTRKVISILLQELDGLDKSKNPILLLGATNVPWMVDEAFLRPGRFDIKIFVGLPDVEARKKMLLSAFSKGGIPRAEGLIPYMAEKTKNYSGADINGVMDRLRQLAYSKNARCYDQSLADEAIASVSPSANGSLLDKIHDWEAEVMPSNSGNTGSNGVKIAERPDVRLSDVAGMEDVKEQIRLRLIEPMRDADTARHYGIRTGGGMLLYGPPGTGKTFLARAIAGELDLPFYMVTAADIFGKYVGESERNVKKLFRDIRKNDLSVVFIDELETLFPSRSAGDVHETTRKVISLLLQELDGMDDTKNPILLLGATNVPWMVDEAFLRPGRFDIRLFVGPPDLAARRHIIYSSLDKGEVSYVEDLPDYMAERTKNYSGADLKGVLDRLRQLAYSCHARYYSHELADEAIASISPSANGALLDKIHEWETETMPTRSGNAGPNGMRICERPSVRLSDVAGMEDVKAQIRIRLIEPLRDASLAKRYGLSAGGGMLLYGPPGTGKTFLAQAVAGELDLPFYSITAADIFGRYVGESEGNVKKLFRDIRKNDLSVVFIDELEAIFPSRSADVHETSRKVISLLLQELDGIDKTKNPILLLGATNVPWMVDEAFLRPGRFDISVYVGLPDLAARRQMVLMALQKGEVPYEERLVDFLAEKTEGYSGADVKGVIDRMRQTAFTRRLPGYTCDVAEEVVAGSGPSVNGSLIRQIREWEESRR